jgi:hypothetical protein
LDGEGEERTRVGSYTKEKAEAGMVVGLGWEEEEEEEEEEEGEVDGMSTDVGRQPAAGETPPEKSMSSCTCAGSSDAPRIYTGETCPSKPLPMWKSVTGDPAFARFAGNFTCADADALLSTEIFSSSREEVKKLENLDDEEWLTVRKYLRGG